MKNLDTFVQHYLICALWASVNENGEPLDGAYSIFDISDEFLNQTKTDCESFLEQAGDLLNDWSEEQAGHDFWLSRNGHGTGFFDRNLPNDDKLQELARKFKEINLYVGDDNLIYGE